MSPHRNPEVWQKLRRDKTSALTVLLVIVAGIAAILAILGLLLGPTRIHDRANPLYWALLLPFARWAASLSAYTSLAARTLRPAAAIAALTTLATLAAAHATQPDLIPWLIAACVAMPCALVGALLYPNTLLARQTPARAGQGAGT